MSSWESRIVRYRPSYYKKGYRYQMRYVILNEEGEIKLAMRTPIEIDAFSKKDLREKIEDLRKAFSKPILEEKDGKLRKIK